MNIILLSGGSGKRLWPLSNDIRSKQFIQLFRKADGEYESMVQRVYRQIRAADPEATVTIATSKSQVSAIRNQLGDSVGVSIEPCRRDTFPAIALATAYLHDVLKVPEDEAVVVCPVDPYVDDAYFQCVRRLCETAQKGEKNLVLMGIEPTYPSEKYGYIQPNGPDGYTFTEKPSKEKAAEYIAGGALWNGGVFAYQLRYVLKKSEELLGSRNYRYLFDHYADLKKISFDYAVVEQETSLEVIRYAGTWKDLGTWNTLSEAMNDQKDPHRNQAEAGTSAPAGNIIGNARMDETCRNLHIINELEIPILAMGIHDAVIAASPDGILVSDKERSGYIKQYVDDIDQQVMFARKSWGNYRVLDVEKDSLTVKVSLKPNSRMNYHSHRFRDEIWTVISGNGRAIVDGETRDISVGDVVHMQAGQKHTVLAGPDGLLLTEVQLGPEISAADKQKFDLPE